VVAGEVLEYEVGLWNQGDGDAVGATFTDPLPAQTTYEPGSAYATSGTIDDTGGIIRWTGVITAHDIIAVFYNARVRGDVEVGTVITNTAEINDGRGTVSILRASAEVVAAGE